MDSPRLALDAKRGRPECWIALALAIGTRAMPIGDRTRPRGGTSAPSLEAYNGTPLGRKCLPNKRPPVGQKRIGRMHTRERGRPGGAHPRSIACCYGSAGKAPHRIDRAIGWANVSATCVAADVTPPGRGCLPPGQALNRPFMPPRGSRTIVGAGRGVPSSHWTPARPQNGSQGVDETPSGHPNCRCRRRYSAAPESR